MRKASCFALLFLLLQSPQLLDAQNSPNRATAPAPATQPATAAPARQPDPNQKVDLVILTTTQGEIVLYLYKDTPLHHANMVKLVNEGYYNGTAFHRIIKNFMIQGGDPNSKDEDPTNDGQGGPGYTQKAEIRSQYYHRRGALAAARLGDEANPYWESSGSQFYIVQGDRVPQDRLAMMQQGAQRNQFHNYAYNVFPNTPSGAWVKTYTPERIQSMPQDSIAALNERYGREMQAAFERDVQPFQYTDAMMKAYAEQGGTPHLDQGYTVFGEVIKGMDVVDKIAAEPIMPGSDHPKEKKPIQARVVTLTWKEMTQKYGTPSVE